jgi:hypothetical protein
MFEFKSLKSGFFDTKAVKDAVDAGTRKAMSKFGAFVRTRAKSSIRKRKKSSPPGSPPSSHAGDLKKLIFFAYDTNTKSVVIGPAAFRKAEAPRLLEHGGTATCRGKPAHYKGNPFMAPAAKAELPGFPTLLKGMIN